MKNEKLKIKNNILKEKSYSFPIEIIKISEQLVSHRESI
jgi:hypothetical protein